MQQMRRVGGAAAASNASSGGGSGGPMKLGGGRVAEHDPESASIQYPSSGGGGQYAETPAAHSALPPAYAQPGVLPGQGVGSFGGGYPSGPSTSGYPQGQPQNYPQSYPQSYPQNYPQGYAPGYQQSSSYSQGHPQGASQGYYPQQPQPSQGFPQAPQPQQPPTQTSPHFFMPAGANLMTAAAASMKMQGGGAGDAAANLQILTQLATNIAPSFLPRNDQVGRWIAWPVNQMRPYFQVTDRYIFKKIFFLLFPFSHQNWQRNIISDGTGLPGVLCVPSTGHDVTQAATTTALPVLYALPKDDMNGPDLYLPAMAFVSYVVLAGLIHGLDGAFTPDVLGVTASSALLLSGLELAAMRLGMTVLGWGAASLPLLDLVALVGYKYVGLVVTLLVGLTRLLPGVAAPVALLYTGLAYAYYAIRVLRVVALPPESTGQATATTSSATTARKRRVYFFLWVGLLSLFFSYFLLLEPKPSISGERGEMRQRQEPVRDAPLMALIKTLWRGSLYLTGTGGDDAAAATKQRDDSIGGKKTRRRGKAPKIKTIVQDVDDGEEGAEEEPILPPSPAR